jgi:hypothetical protein
MVVESCPQAPVRKVEKYGMRCRSELLRWLGWVELQSLVSRAEAGIECCEKDANHSFKFSSGVELS